MTDQEQLQIEGLTNADILELESQSKLTRLPSHQTTTGAHHEPGMAKIIISASAPILTLLGIIIARKGKSSRKKIKILRITKDEKTWVNIEEQDTSHEAPKADVIKAVASALKIDPTKISEALSGK